MIIIQTGVDIMKSYLKKMAALLLAVILTLGVLPVNAQILTGHSDFTVDEIGAETESFWQNIEPKEKQLLDSKADKSTFMQQSYKLISKQSNVSDLKWDDEDTFSFVLSKGMTCVYDYDLRMAELKSADSEPTGSIEVYDYTRRAAHTTQCTDTVVFGPYYGEDTSFTDYYKTLGQRIASAKGGTCTVLSGTEATPAAIRAKMQTSGICTYIFDTHGITYPKDGSRQASSYVGVAADLTGVTDSDIQNYHIISLSGGKKFGIDGYFMTNMGQYRLPDSFIWMAACESMMTYGLAYPFIYSGAGAVLGYSQSISFTRDYQWAGVFWDDMLDGKTVEYAAAHMKERYSVPDPYGGVNAYPIFMWDDGSGDAIATYPANPDSEQTVTSQWRLINNDPLYTVTFRDWNNTTLSTQRVYKNEDATAPAAPARTGYTFTGWNGSYTNVQSNLTLTAQYEINHYTVTFLDWNGTVLKTQDVTHGSAATAPSVPARANYTFSGWDKTFSNVTEDLTVTAQYIKTRCTVTFVDWDGTVLKTQEVDGGSSATAPEVPERTGYTFKGWDRSFANVTEDITVTAQYEQVNIHVKFLNWDGTVLKEYNAAYGSMPEAPLAVPQRTGYTFKDWDYSISYPIYSDMTYTAQFEINKYNVYFIDYNNAVLKSDYVAHGSNAVPPADPTRTGYRFTGWDKSYTNVQSNLYIYAQYEVYNAPQITVETAYGRSGQEVEVRVYLANNPGADSVSFTLSYDTSKLTFVSAQNGGLFGDMAVSGNTFTLTNGSSVSANGTLATVKFNVTSGLESGVNVPVTITLHSMSNGGSPVSHEIVSGTVIINNLVIGDVNNDGIVNTRDAVVLLQYLADMDVEINEDAADINRNGNITTQDAVYILKYMVDDASVAHFFAPSAM